jgi:hypothetical protein
MKSIINNIKKNLNKMISLRDSVFKIKKSNNKFMHTLSTLISIPVLSYFYYYIYDFLLLEPQWILSIILLLLISCSFYMISLMISMVISPKLSSFFHKKQRNKISEIGYIELYNNDYYTKKELNKIIDANNKISKECEEFKHIYLNVNIKQENLFINIIFEQLKKEVITIENYQEYLSIGKENLSSEEYVLFFRSILNKYIKSISRSDFFKNKSILIDLILKENFFSTDDKKKLTLIIRNSVDNYNKDKQENKKIEEELKYLKIVEDSQEEKITISKKEKKLIIKSV